MLWICLLFFENPLMNQLLNPLMNQLTSQLINQHTSLHTSQRVSQLSNQRKNQHMNQLMVIIKKFFFVFHFLKQSSNFCVYSMCLVFSSSSAAKNIPIWWPTASKFSQKIHFPFRVSLLLTTDYWHSTTNTHTHTCVTQDWEILWMVYSVQRTQFFVLA